MEKISSSRYVGTVTQEEGREIDVNNDDDLLCRETEEIWNKMSRTRSAGGNRNESLIRRTKSEKKSQVLLEGYVEGACDSEDDLKRTRSLTDDDLDELKGCLDLGFGFSYDEIPELCNTLPALELCYSMSQKFLDGQHKSPERSEAPAAVDESASGTIANWKISSPGDHPEDVKARLKYWAQAVACTVKLCS